MKTSLHLQFCKVSLFEGVDNYLLNNFLYWNNNGGVVIFDKRYINWFLEYDPISQSFRNGFARNNYYQPGRVLTIENQDYLKEYVWKEIKPK